MVWYGKFFIEIVTRVQWGGEGAQIFGTLFSIIPYSLQLFPIFNENVCRSRIGKGGSVTPHPLFFSNTLYLSLLTFFEVKPKYRQKINMDMILTLHRYYFYSSVNTIYLVLCCTKILNKWYFSLKYSIKHKQNILNRKFLVLPCRHVSGISKFFIFEGVTIEK